MFWAKSCYPLNLCFITVFQQEREGGGRIPGLKKVAHSWRQSPHMRALAVPIQQAVAILGISNGQCGFLMEHQTGSQPTSTPLWLGWGEKIWHSTVNALDSGKMHPTMQICHRSSSSPRLMSPSMRSKIQMISQLPEIVGNCTLTTYNTVTRTLHQGERKIGISNPLD